MANKIRVWKDALIALALTVPSGTLADTVVLLGTAGLKGYALTPQATTATIAAGTAAPGLVDQQASVRLINVSLVVDLVIVNAVAQYAKVYVANDGTYTATATSNTFVGYALDALAGAGTTRVALTNA